MIQLLRTREACAYLRCSRQTLARLVARGRIAVVRLGSRNLRYAERELERFVSTNTRRAK